MRVTLKIELLGLLAAALFVSAASAELDEEALLPDSSYYDGSTFFSEWSDQGMVNGRIDFAVYDTEIVNEWTNAGYDPVGVGQFIYAYQIFAAPEGSYQALIDSFTISSFDGANEDDIGAQDDGLGGIESFFNTDNYVWEFNQGVLWADEHSWLLAFSTDHDWVDGTYTVTAADNPPNPVPGPEPGMLSLLGLGAAMVLRKRRAA